MSAHAVAPSSPWTRFRSWARSRPFVGGLLVVLGGIELFCSGQLDLGNIRIQFGIEGLQATVIPIALVALGVLAVCSPAQRIFYGIVALVLAVYSLIGVNLGGFLVGMLLAAVGGVLVVAWMPASAKSGSSSSSSASSASSRSGGDGVEESA